MSKKPVLLCIMDGFGWTPNETYGNAVVAAKKPFLDSLMAKYPMTTIDASGMAVGLPDGQMGNSEVGHTNMGAGRIVYQQLTLITKSIRDGEMLKNPVLVKNMKAAIDAGKAIHLMGLVGTGGVHSHADHWFGVLEMAKQMGAKEVYLHCITDGRDTDPHSGKGFLADLQAKLDELGIGKIASVSGRYYAMDRDNNWDRVKLAYDMLTAGKGEQTSDVVKAVEASYEAGITDEFLKPIVNDTVDGRIGAGHVVIFFNYRNDRAKEITIALTQHDQDGMKPVPDLQYYCMTPYDDSFHGVHILFPKEDVQMTLAEYLSTLGKKQLHIAETEKYAHVTFFFNGGREAPFAGEERILIPSPKVATYDLKPEMSAYEVTDKLVEALGTEKYDFAVVNFANGDMVGHTGVYPAIQDAIRALDVCVGKVVKAATGHGYSVIIIADHGNADHAINEDGTPNPAHSLNPVPFIYISDDKNARVSNGRLADVAPSVLHVMGIPQPAEMTSRNLIED